jgi:hypothetical protein
MRAQGRNGEATTYPAVADERGPDDGEGLYLVARLYALLDDRAGALRMAEQAVDRGSFVYPYLVADPFRDSIRDDAVSRQP